MPRLKKYKIAKLSKKIFFDFKNRLTKIPEKLTPSGIKKIGNNLLRKYSFLFRLTLVYFIF